LAATVLVSFLHAARHCADRRQKVFAFRLVVIRCVLRLLVAYTITSAAFTDLVRVARFIHHPVQRRERGFGSIAGRDVAAHLERHLFATLRQRARVRDVPRWRAAFIYSLRTPGPLPFGGYLDCAPHRSLWCGTRFGWGACCACSVLRLPTTGAVLRRRLLRPPLCWRHCCLARFTCAFYCLRTTPYTTVHDSARSFAEHFGCVPRLPDFTIELPAGGCILPCLLLAPTVTGRSFSCRLPAAAPAAAAALRRAPSSITYSGAGRCCLDGRHHRFRGCSFVPRQRYTTTALPQWVLGLVLFFIP